MSRPSSRRPPQQATPQYAAVPSSPSRVQGSQYLQPSPGVVGGPRPVRSSSRKLSRRTSAGQSQQQQQQQQQQLYQQQQQGRNAVAMGVATGNIGAGYGPYSYQPQNLYASNANGNGRFSNTPSQTSAESVPTREKAPIIATTTTVPQYMWDRDPDVDDAMHNPDPRGDWSFTPFSGRGWMNIGGIFILLLGLLMLFIGYPVILVVRHPKQHISGWNVGGINGTGQIPQFTNFPRLIDDDTPQNVMSRTGTDGKTYDLVFSDEFNTDGRTFYPGDDAFWEAVDLHYWPTGNAEWYDPSAVTTQDGKLVITMTEQRVHDLNFQSGMITSWNKLCFTTGYVEVSISLPGSPKAPGLWPGAWTLGNLGRAGYGATTEGLWPYSYDTCDSGTYPSQQDKSGAPAAASTGGNNGSPLSGQPGQRLSACTCPGSDHPGPRVNVGRGVPEIDLIEAQVETTVMQGEASQSFQVAPYDMGYNWDDTSPATTIYDTNRTKFNTYKGGPLQQALSALTFVDDEYYGGNAYTTYGYEWWSDPNKRGDGYVTWFYNQVKTWTVTAASIGPNTDSKVGQRLIPEEPMYLILNLGMGSSFQKPDFKHLTFPTKMYIDYVRIYQRRGTKNGITCDPPNRPTSDYISRHMGAYTNANLTTWAQANQTFPRNRMYDGC